MEQTRKQLPAWEQREESFEMLCPGKIHSLFWSCMCVRLCARSRVRVPICVCVYAHFLSVCPLPRGRIKFQTIQDI